MTSKELDVMIRELKKVFDIVRLVDPTTQRELELTYNGDIVGTCQHCYAMWQKNHACHNCTSARALGQRKQFSRFELLDGQVLNIISKYVEIDGQPHVLEMIHKIANETLFGAFGKTEFLQNIMNFSKTMYIDTLTGAYNRRFFEEQFCALESQCAVAFVDLDHFKSINDTYGHDVGDIVLKTTSEVIISNVRNEDAVIRYGGEEFVISFAQMPKKAFTNRLEQIRQAVMRITFEDYPALNITVSIGGYYSMGDDRMSMVKEADKLCYAAKVKRNDVKVKIN